MEKKKLLVSFSGGRTSAYMLWWCYQNLSEEYELKTVFANTGKEVEGTLQFVDKCATIWNIPIVWVEARHIADNGTPYSKKGWSVRHKIVDFETASRNGEPFEEMISVLGIPCSEAPFCSDQLKRKAIEDYLKSEGWINYYKAIGIRCDEIDRVNENHKKLRIIYPLVSMVPTTKSQVLDWWSEQTFDLEIDQDDGNCDNCWKKKFSLLTKKTITKPESFDWWQRMIDKYGKNNARLDGKPQTFFRGGKTIQDLVDMAALDAKQLDLFAEENKLNSCEESCEVW